MKHPADYFHHRPDGIFSIDVKSYKKFYRALGETIHCQDKGQPIIMLKKNQTYMFFACNAKHQLCLLSGGSKKKIGAKPLEYYYALMDDYCRSLKVFLAQYEQCLSQLSEQVKSIGGSGHIHGTIIDIDFYNHLSLDPFSGRIIPYYALNTVNLTLYPTIENLLEAQCPRQYKQYLAHSGLIPYQGEMIIKPAEVDPKAMYQASRIMKGLQYTTKHNVIRIWNDELAKEPFSQASLLSFIKE